MNDDRRIQIHVSEDLSALPRISADDLRNAAYWLAVIFIGLLVFVAMTARPVTP